MGDYAYEGRASIAVGTGGDPPEPRIGIYDLSADHWIADVLDYGPAELPVDDVLVTLSDEPNAGWSAKASIARVEGSDFVVLNGRSAFQSPV